jgi:hypothetical protein
MSSEPPPPLSFACAVGGKFGSVPVMFTESSVLPPVPVHRSVYVVVPVMTVTDWLPEVVFVPLQPSIATQDVALVVVHDSVLLVPEVTLDELAVRLTVGAGAGGGGGGAPVTVTLAVC